MSSQNQPNDSDKQPGSSSKLQTAVHVGICTALALAFVLFILTMVSMYRAEANRERPVFDDFAEICEVKNAWWSDGMLIRVGSDAEVMYVPSDVAEPADVTVGEVYNVAYTYGSGLISFYLTLGDASATVVDIEQGLPVADTMDEIGYDARGHCE